MVYDGLSAELDDFETFIAHVMKFISSKGFIELKFIHPNRPPESR